MTPEIRHLLGGYATGTLTEAERAKLFAAALEDQDLFDALAEEQQLKDVLDDPEARGYLLAELDQLEAAPAVQPVAMAAAAPRAGGAAVPVKPPPPPARFWLPFSAVMIALLMTSWFWWRHEPAPTHEMARNVPPAAAPAAVQTAAQSPKATAPEPEKPKESRRGPVAAPAPKPAAVRQDAVADAQPAKKELDLRAESTVEKRQEPAALEAPAPAAPPAPAVALGGASANAFGAIRPSFRIRRLENGQYVPTADSTRFQAGDSIVILLPLEPPQQLMTANGKPIALERDGDGYRSSKIELASGIQEFIVAPDNAAPGRSRFAAADREMSKAKAAPAQAGTGFRIRLNVD